MTTLAILGASGFVGKLLVEKATRAGHAVRVLVRSPEKLGALRGEVEVIPGDMHDAEALTRLVAGVDAVISVAGPPLARRYHDSEHHAAAMRLLIPGGMPRPLRFASCGGTAPHRDWLQPLPCQLATPSSPCPSSYLASFMSVPSASPYPMLAQ